MGEPGKAMRFEKVKGAFYAALQQKNLTKVREESAQQCAELQEKLDRTEKELRAKNVALQKENGELFFKEAQVKKDYTKERAKRIELEKEVRALKNKMEDRIADETKQFRDAIAKYKESLDKCRAQTQSSLKLVQTVVYELQRQEAQSRALSAEVQAIRHSSSSPARRRSSAAPVSASVRLKSDVDQLTQDAEALANELARQEADLRARGSLSDDGTGPVVPSSPPPTKQPEDADGEDPPREFLSPPLPVSPCSKREQLRNQWTVPRQGNATRKNKAAVTDPGARRLAAAMIRQSAASDTVYPFQSPSSPPPSCLTAGPRSPRRAKLAPRVDLGFP
mmetsp:Transcript_8874/g.27307  ORF Transcript_8874/g.27307 Transcript_8874/m.27307 type:complete len:336 (-) Transcript_8874:65-1072(-)